MRILFVDHDENQSSKWQKLLAKQGVDVELAPDCEEANTRIEHGLYSCVIASWISLQQSANKNEFAPQLKTKCKCVFCLVDRSIPEQLQAAYAAGFDDCIFTDSPEEMIRAKVEQIRQLDELDRRLAKAQKLESIGELAAGIAHEINTPIQYVGDNTRFVQAAYQDLTEVLTHCQGIVTAISEGKDVSGTAEELREAMENADVEYLQEEIPSAVKQTLEGVDRVANIVRAMKEFAHPGASEMTSTDLAKSIENTVMVARNEWKYVADLETDFDPELPLVPCLPGELNQVLLNMIVNAAHAIGDSLGDSPDEKGTIRISTRLDTAHAEIRIADSGSGISKENIDKIFTPFFTTKAAGKGTGQGLAIAHSVVVENHGGTIAVESTVGQGTTFIIRLPLESPRKVEENAQLATV